MLSNYNRANGVAVFVAGRVCGNRLLERLMSSSPISCPHSHESVIFSYFWHSYFLRYTHYVDYMNMHAINMWLTDASGR